MRATVFHRLMHRLALAATFALLVMPVAGRLAQAARAGEAHHGHQMAMAGAMHHAAPETPPPPHHGNGDCDYCPLLQSLVSPDVPSLAAVADTVPVAPAVVEAAAPPNFRHPNGLGSRGPPSFS
ncbi:DUF2946 family protein [Noviluteimonas dokdonensis]|nr:DUF2946 family protein [Lysobacter dokdonensis]